MKKIIISVSGMSCNHCEEKIKTSLKKLDGVISVRASFKDKKVEVISDDSLKESKIKEVIESLGYKCRSTKEDKNSKISIKEILPILLIILGVYFVVKLLFGFNFLNFLPTVDETTSIGMLFVIGLFTSVHCISMCGAINIAVSTSGSKSIKKPLLYNLGRIISYTIVGGLVGGLGSLISFNNTIEGILILVASILMFMMGLSMLGWLPKKLYKLLPRLPFNKLLKNNNNSFVVGLLNGLMPCGPLQVMQLYALSTGSVFMGALSMFVFSLGTLPLMLGFGMILTTLKGKYTYVIQRISSVLILLLSIFMLSRSFNYLNINLDSIKYSSYKDYAIAEIKDGYQYVEINLESYSYKPILVQKDIPVKFNIKVDIIQRYGCTRSLVIPEFNIEYNLRNGDNYIEFTPTEVKDISYSCWMGMVSSNIKVVEDISEIRKGLGR